MKVRELMTPVVHTLQPHATLHEAARAHWEHDCGLVPIVDDASGVLGVITDRDVCMAAYIQGRPLQEITVDEIMSTDLITCGPDDDARDALRCMAEGQVHRLVVLDDRDRLHGVLSINDVALGSAKGKVDATRVVDALSKITAPRPQAAAAR
ncbi:MAG: CBS domain-containing protein [Planctomycetota bacterium]